MGERINRMPNFTGAVPLDGPKAANGNLINRLGPDQLSAAVENLQKLEDRQAVSSGPKIIAEDAGLRPDQLSGAVKNLRDLETRGAAMFGRQVAEAPVGRREYRDVDYWREWFAKLLARSAAVVSVDKPLVVRK